jgi:hypothetical protein
MYPVDQLNSAIETNHSERKSKEKFFAAFETVFRSVFKEGDETFFSLEKGRLKI